MTSCPWTSASECAMVDERTTGIGFPCAMHAREHRHNCEEDDMGRQECLRCGRLLSTNALARAAHDRSACSPEKERARAAKEEAREARRCRKRLTVPQLRAMATVDRRARGVE